MTIFEKNLVSTVVPAYNRACMMHEAVMSVLAQTWRPIEVIIVDDGSTDDTLSAAQALVTAHPEMVRVISIDNSGPGPAREAGRQLARGEFIQYLDSDDRLLPEKFARQIGALRDRPDCGIAYGGTRLIDAKGHLLRSPFKWTGRHIEYLFPALLVDRWWCTHTPLYRREVTDAIGPWSDLRYSQDWEHDARAGALGIRLVNCREAVSEHRTHEGHRQTSHGRWLEPSDRVRFFSTLWDCARQAGVGLETPEMRHFSRWVFAHARQCGELGDADASRSLLELAGLAAGGQAIDLRTYGLMAHVLGYRGAARLGSWVARSRGGRSGRQTLKQSWMRR